MFTGIFMRIQTGSRFYVPAPAEYAQNATSYSALAFAQRTHWDQWLAAQTQ